MTGNELKIAAKNSELLRLKNFFINSPPSLTRQMDANFLLRFASRAIITDHLIGER